jgi:hypothetical protein
MFQGIMRAWPSSPLYLGWGPWLRALRCRRGLGRRAGAVAALVCSSFAQPCIQRHESVHRVFPPGNRARDGQCQNPSSALLHGIPEIPVFANLGTGIEKCCGAFSGSKHQNELSGRRRAAVISAKALSVHMPG